MLSAGCGIRTEWATVLVSHPEFSFSRQDPVAVGTPYDIRGNKALSISRGRQALAAPRSSPLAASREAASGGRHTDDRRRGTIDSPIPRTAPMLPLPVPPLVRLGNLFPGRDVFAKCEFL